MSPCGAVYSTRFFSDSWRDAGIATSGWQNSGMPRPIEALVHRDAIAANLEVARRAAAGARVWAVVKADAYGHGIVNVFPALRRADGFALLDIAEA